MRRVRLRRGKGLRRVRRLRDRVTDKELDAACRALVFARDRHRCLHCGKQSNLQWAHVISRRYRSVRWDPANSMTLCAGCHLWWHHQPVAAVLWWVGKFGQDAHDMLRLRLQHSGKTDRPLTLMWLKESIGRYSLLP